MSSTPASSQILCEAATLLRTASATSSSSSPGISMAILRISAGSLFSQALLYQVAVGI